MTRTTARAIAWGGAFVTVPALDVALGGPPRMAVTAIGGLLLCGGVMLASGYVFVRVATARLDACDRRRRARERRDGFVDQRRRGRPGVVRSCAGAGPHGDVDIE